MPRKEVVFFVDRSLGKHHVPEALRAAGARVELHDDHFRPDAPDSEWIGKAARRGWVVLTKDKRIRHHPLERSAVTAARARMFVLTMGNVTGREMASVLGRHLRRMEGIARSTPPPFVARVSQTRVLVERLRE